MLNITGQKFGKLTPVSYESRGHRIYWTCLCDCGSQVENIRTDYLRSGISTQCCSCTQSQIHFDKLILNLDKKLNDSHFVCIPELSDIKAHTRLITKCTEHNNFSEVRLSTLLNSERNNSVCKQCDDLQKRAVRLEAFKNKASQLYFDFYDYSESSVDFIDGRSKVKVICPDHGAFQISFSSHVAGHRCSKCNYHLTVNQFKDKMYPVHKDRYDYTNVVYKHSHTKVEIICPKHGAFLQTPALHFRGAGCRECSLELNAYSFVERYQLDKESGSKLGLLYLMLVTGEDEKFFKVGITSQMNKRLNMYNRVKEYKFEIIKTWEMTNLDTALVEDKILYKKKRNGMHYNPKHKFDGRFECIKYQYKNDIIEMIEEEILTFKAVVATQSVTGRSRDKMTKQYLEAVKVAESQES